MNSKGFLGTNASVLADLTLLLSLTVATILTIGVVMAVKKRYGVHRWLQTTAVALNALLVLLVMIASFFKKAVPGIPAQLDRPYYYVALIHGCIGIVAFLFGSFVALRGNELVPSALKFNNYKRFMRIAYGLYLLATAIGVWVYITWYGSADAGGPAASQQEGQLIVPMTNFIFNPEDLTIPVGTTVIWVNNDPAPHTATADDGKAFDSGELQTTDAFTFTFDTIGEFSYYCLLHGSPGGVDMAAKIKVVPADQAPALAAASVAAPTPQPTPHPLPTQYFGQPAGVAAFRDIKGSSDGLVLELKLDPAQVPASGQSLFAFLTTADGASALPLGAIQIAGDRGTLQFNTPDASSLIGQFNRILITQEPAGSAPTKPAGPPAFENTLPAAAYPALRQLLVDQPEGRGFAVLLQRQADELERHIQFIAQAQAAGDMAAVNRHAEHVFNLVAGSRDPSFGDRNGDGKAQNPGDGFGLLKNGDQNGYIGQSADAAFVASKAADATDAIKVHAGHVQVCAQNMQGWAAQSREIALALTQAKDPAAAAAQVAELSKLGAALTVGEDANGDGHITPTPGECGARVAYEHAQYMAGFGLFPVKP